MPILVGDGPNGKSLIMEATPAWAIDGAKAYFTDGCPLLPPTESMKAAKDERLRNMHRK